MARRGRITRAFTIRQYRDSDEAQVVELARELQAFEAPLYQWGKPPEDIGPWYLEETMKWCAKNEGLILVAERDNALLGYATLLTKCESDGTGDEIAYIYAHVADLVVTKSARRQGIGEALLKACEQEGRSKGRKVFRINVLALNTGAIAAYRRFGFASYLQTLEKILE
jgi:ribosomal protein S18 acetylase RimI-like enzyme